MERAYVGLGSNIGDRERHLEHALRRLAGAAALEAVSGVYETEPVGYLQQPPFLNAVARVGTSLGPRGLLALARDIEAERNRERAFPGAPRTLDVDILLYGDRIVEEPGLRVPHPRMADRAFVLVPLLELDGDLTDPVTGVPYGERLARLRRDAGAADGPAGLDALGLRRVMRGERLLDDATP